MRIRSFVGRRGNRRASPWWDRAALAVIVLLIAAFVVVAIDNVRRHDTLTRWRTSLEAAAGNPSGSKRYHFGSQAKPSVDQQFT